MKTESTHIEHTYFHLQFHLSDRKPDDVRLAEAHKRWKQHNEFPQRIRSALLRELEAEQDDGRASSPSSEALNELLHRFEQQEHLLHQVADELQRLTVTNPEPSEQELKQGLKQITGILNHKAATKFGA